MASYLEEHELIIGLSYSCETYDGQSVILIYVGNGVFRDEEFEYHLEGDIRYVWKSVLSVIKDKLS